MKPVHLLCHCEAYTHMPITLFKTYASIESQEQMISVKWQEETDLSHWVRKAQETGLMDFQDFDHYYWGYTIEHISKEFDLLRIGTNYAINIELKHQSSDEKILKQLCLNQYYLKTLGCQVYYFTYVVDKDQLYQLVDDHLEKVDFEQLTRLIHHQNVKENIDIDHLFEPSKFLVSPLNQAVDFLEGRYFLTNQQQDFKGKILTKLSSERPQPLMISGMAGTGKTLLLYDIAKTVMSENKDVVILQIGKLSNGQEYLIKHGYDICPFSQRESIESCHLILLDETQHLSLTQIQNLIQWANEHQCFCLMALDGYEMLYKNGQEYRCLANEGCYFELSGHIRINSKLMQFISQMFEPEKRYLIDFSDHVDIYYFKNHQLALEWLSYSQSKGYTFIHDSISYAHKTEDVIGMEYDKVAVMIDAAFKVENNRFMADGKLLEHLYIQLTRARQKLRIVIVDNVEVFQYCMDILNKNSNGRRENDVFSQK